jgi:hypothetical protein
MSLKRRVRAERLKPTCVYIVFLCENKNTAKLTHTFLEGEGGRGERGQGQAFNILFNRTDRKKAWKFSHFFSVLCYNTLFVMNTTNFLKQCPVSNPSISLKIYPSDFGKKSRIAVFQKHHLKKQLFLAFTCLSIQAYFSNGMLHMSHLVLY